jgi:hypothetical protein
MKLKDIKKSNQSKKDKRLGKETEKLGQSTQSKRVKKLFKYINSHNKNKFKMKT